MGLIEVIGICIPIFFILYIYFDSGIFANHKKRFNKKYLETPNKNITFDDIKDKAIVFVCNNFYIMEDGFPVSGGHLLIVSKNVNKKNYFDLNTEEQNELNFCILKCKDIIENDFGLKPNGYNIGMNCGQAAGQSVMQFHCHIIPRYNGDMKNPKGGIRNCIPSKGCY